MKKSKTLYECLGKDIFNLTTIDEGTNTITFLYNGYGSTGFISTDMRILHSLEEYLMDTYNLTMSEANTVWWEFKNLYFDGL